MSATSSTSFKIPRCYDSHVHWMATGMVHSILNLSGLKSPQEIKSLHVPAASRSGDWIIGFGWDQHNWPGQHYPDRQILDEVFGPSPVYLSRADGHAVWTNSAGLKLSGLLDTSSDHVVEGGVICRDEKGEPTGVLIETAKALLDPFVPEYTKEQQRGFLQQATRVFNQAGFTHIRDLGGDPRLWELATEMDRTGELSLYVDVNFSFFKEESLEATLDLAKHAKETGTPHVRAQGIKFFLDGALGSSGAYLSQVYPGTESRGLLLWQPEQVREFLQRIWKEGFAAAVHCIGDAACELLAIEALELKEQGIVGSLNVEHGQVIRTETIQKLKKLGACVHMQPCHWLSDQSWLKSKLGSLYPFVFPWAELESQGVDFFFGSDTPIEPPSVFNNLKVLSLAAKDGIKAPRGEALSFHSHPDLNWGSQCTSSFSSEGAEQVCFDGEMISIS